MKGEQRCSFKEQMCDNALLRLLIRYTHFITELTVKGAAVVLDYIILRALSNIFSSVFTNMSCSEY